MKTIQLTFLFEDTGFCKDVFQSVNQPYYLSIISIPHGLVLQIVQEFLGILNIWRGPAPN